jgi:hypothetical protein
MIAWRSGYNHTPQFSLLSLSELILPLLQWGGHSLHPPFLHPYTPTATYPTLRFSRFCSFDRISPLHETSSRFFPSIIAAQRKVERLFSSVFLSSCLGVLFLPIQSRFLSSSQYSVVPQVRSIIFFRRSSS